MAYISESSSIMRISTSPLSNADNMVRFLFLYERLDGWLAFKKSQSGINGVRSRAYANTLIKISAQSKPVMYATCCW